MSTRLAQSRTHLSSRLLGVIALAATAFITPTITVASGLAATAASSMTPAVGVHPHFVRAGKAHPGADVVFSCQATNPPRCYGPAQIRAAYGIDKLGATGLNGSGTSITIIDAYSAPAIRHDLELFDRVFGLPSTKLNIVAPQGLTPFDQTDPNQVGWSAEISLDVQWAHAIAPGARINLVLAKSSQDPDILAATKWVVDHNVGDVISQSFGEAEQCVNPELLAQEHRLFATAARQGQTVFASAGDQGAAQAACVGDSFFKAASSPASDPLVTGVGGTSLLADGVTGAYKSEQTWNEPSFEAAGGGGYSVVYPEPGFQRSAQSSGKRAVPDISYNGAIERGVIVAWSTSGQGPDAFFIFGGTSAGSPQWAGLISLADQLKRGRVGLINSKLYGLASSPATYAGLFHDITKGDNTYHGAVTVPGFKATKGWDAATGLGTPKAQALVPALTS